MQRAERSQIWGLPGLQGKTTSQEESTFKNSTCYIKKKIKEEADDMRNIEIRETSSWVHVCARCPVYTNLVSQQDPVGYLIKREDVHMASREKAKKEGKITLDLKKRISFLF